ncbi:MAG: ABC transporter ATP-binding protein [Planctomycetota bacterium]|mgnify:CR=1 FL=1
MEVDGTPDRAPIRAPRVLRRLFGFVHLRLVLVAVAWLSVGLVFELLIPQVAGEAINFLRPSGGTYRPPRVLQALLGVLGYERPPGILFFALLLLALTGFRALVDLLYHRARVRSVQTSLSDLRVAIFDKIQRMGLSARSAFGAGDLIARSSRDVSKTREFFAAVLFVGWDVGFTILSAAFFIIAIHAVLGAACLSPAPFTIALLAVFAIRARRKWLASNDRYGELATVLQENVAGARVVRTFGQEEESRRKYQGRAEGYLAAYLDAVRYVSARMPMAQFLFGLSVPIALGVGCFLVIDRVLSMGDVVKVLLYLMKIVDRMRHVGQVVSGLQVSAASAVRIFEVLDAPLGIAEPAAPKPLPDGRGRIRFEEVTAGYGGRRALDGVTLSIEPGEWVAVLGGMGAGKSTLLRLIPRLLDPSTGRVLIDGEDVRKMSLSGLRRSIGFVPQEAFLFSDTIRGNIAYGRPDATEDEIREAARIACADEFLALVEGGLDAVIGERGVTLSGGQRQRIALARAILLKPRILLLDDPTSAVDASTERQILENLREVRGVSTVLFVTHRVPCARRADRLVFLERGRLAAEDASSDRIVRSSHYRRFVESQAVI